MAIETFLDYQEAVDFLNGKRERPIGHATRLYHWDNRVFVFHHGNEIFVMGKDGSVSFSFAGWASKTTTERLDALARRAGLGIRFNLSKGRPIVSVTPVTHSVVHSGEVNTIAIYRVTREVTKDGEETIVLKSRVPEETMTFKL